MKFVKIAVVAAALLAGQAVAGACKTTSGIGVCTNLMIQSVLFREDGMVELTLQDRQTKESVDTTILLDANRVGQSRFNGMYPIIQMALPAKLTIWLSYTVKDGKRYLDEILAYQPDMAL